jgi:hypothetical protein
MDDPVSTSSPVAADVAVSAAMVEQKPVRWQCTQFVAIQLGDVKRIGVTAAVGVFGLVGRREQQQPTRRQHASDFSQELALGSDVFDGFERHHQIERRVGKRKLRAIGGHEAQVGPILVLSFSVRDRIGCRIDADDFARGQCQQRAAVALARGHIEDAPVARQRGREVITMPVLEPDLALAIGQEAFPGECQTSHGHSLLHVRSRRSSRPR